MLKPSSPRQQDVVVGSHLLPGTLYKPQDAFGLVIFAHGSGSSRLSARNRRVAESLSRKGMAALLFDLLRPREETQNDRAKVFDIPLLAHRVMDAVTWGDRHGYRNLPVGLFGASTGAAAALMAAANLGERIGAVVSRGGRPDLAGDVLHDVLAPTLLIVGGSDRDVLDLNRLAQRQLKGLSSLEVIPGATHLFPEPGAMEKVVTLAIDWFERYLGPYPI